MVGVNMNLQAGFPGCLQDNRVYCTRHFNECDGFEGTVFLIIGTWIYVKLDGDKAPGQADGVWVDTTGGDYEITVVHS